MNQVATKILLENDTMIVWDLTLEPGESTGVHTHVYDYLVHVIEGSTLLATDANGENQKEVSLEADDTFYFAVRGDVAMAGELQTTATHNAKNIGPGRYREIMVEMK
jgi:predicted metal-dependent enzyme (double-stranded beta helix superfamily)